MTRVRYLLMAEVLHMHREAILRYGGLDGVRDQGTIEAALARPQLCIGGYDAFPTMYLKAAAYLDSFARNHAFADGNKRIGYMSAGLFLSKNEISLEAPTGEAEAFVLDVVSSSPPIENIAGWIALHCVLRGVNRNSEIPGR
jgi:death-on-curing protein